jgi:hypothetical protein
MPRRSKRGTAQPGDLNEDDDLPRDIAASIQVSCSSFKFTISLMDPEFIINRIIFQ